jgi:hypothetical protein
MGAATGAIADPVGIEVCNILPAAVSGDDIAGRVPTVGLASILRDLRRIPADLAYFCTSL